MTRRGRLDGDPQGSEKPRGKDRSERRGRFDPGWTPTETHIRNGLMKQFCKNPEGSPNSEAYRNSEIWCRYPGCKRMNGTHSHPSKKP
jgi:hypothetical protein